MYLQPILRCKNRNCLRSGIAPIRLPYANPTGANEQPPAWPPEGWQIILTCSKCGHWYVYKRDDIEWTRVVTPSDLAMWVVELQCNEPNCESRTKWHVLDDGSLSEDEIVGFVKRSDPFPLCSEGHSLVFPAATVLSTQKLSSL
jgi:hypothetical protein